MKITIFRLRLAFACISSGNGIKNALYFFHSSYSFKQTKK